MVGPVAMQQQQSLQIVELGYAVVTVSAKHQHPFNLEESQLKVRLSYFYIDFKHRWDLGVEVIASGLAFKERLGVTKILIFRSLQSPEPSQILNTIIFFSFDEANFL